MTGDGVAVWVWQAGGYDVYCLLCDELEESVDPVGDNGPTPT
jgi:hypothetical protein